jgi:anti-sigma regulatory factor (Ser/Thr protein kinase)
LTEAHDSARDMFGSPRLAGVMAEAGPGRGDQLIEALLSALAVFTGGAQEQEDDITLVAIRRVEVPILLAEFSVASEPGNEREAIRRLEPLLASQGIASARLERLKTAVAEATMNAMEHGNGFRPDTPVELSVLADHDAIRVRVTDQGGARPVADAAQPDLEAKLAGDQTPRGWGLFLIRNMVDEMLESVDDQRHTLELVLRREGGVDGDHA